MASKVSTESAKVDREGLAPSRLLTVPEAASILGRSDGFVRGLIQKRRLRSMRINGRYYVPGWSIEELVRPSHIEEPVSFAMEVSPPRRRRADQSAVASGHGGGGRNGE